MKQTDRVPHKARGAAQSAGVPAERAGTTKTSYPLMKYLSLLLAVALLFSGVTFARYLSNDRIDASVGIAVFDATYSIDRVNTTTFGNENYWIQTGTSGDIPQGAGSEITVGITLKNNGDTSVQPTLHLEGPKEYWDHIALQLTTADENFATGDVLTPQLVIGDITAAADGSFNTESSTDYGSLGGDAILDVDSVTDGDKTTTTTATWGENVMTITKKTDTIDYSVGFVRESGDTLLPPVFVDCQKKTAVYSIDFQLPALNVDAAEDGEKKPSEQRVIVWLTWTDDAPNKSTAANVTFWENLAAGASFTIENETITILGYHYDVPGVPVVDEDGLKTDETTTVRLKKTLKLGEAEGEISYYHVASINDGDGYYPHKAEKVKGNVYECSGPSPVCFDVSGIEEFKEEDVTVIQMNEQKYAPIQQRAFGVSFRATFVQWSEVPAI